MIEQQSAQIALLQEQLTWLKRQLFGAKSERMVADLGQQSLPFAEAEVAADPVAAATEEIRYQRRKSARNRGRDTISYPDDLPVERRMLDLPEERKICAETGEPLVRIGEEVTRKLARKLARKAEQFFIIEYVRPKYASRKNPDQGVLTAALPDSVIDRCPVDESLLASVLTAKYADHLPLYRQAQMLRRSDVQISRQTLSKWVLSLGAGLAPLYEAMKARILASGVIFVDESPVSLQSQSKGPCKKAYMWVYAGGGGGDPPYRFFDFRTSRSHAHVEQTLKEYQGSCTRISTPPTRNSPGVRISSGVRAWRTPDASLSRPKGAIRSFAAGFCARSAICSCSNGSPGRAAPKSACGFAGRSRNRFLRV